jgi:dienelactone hydrolase
LAEAGVTHEISIYDGVGHAFVEYSELNDGGPAQEAWEEMTAFLEDNLMPERTEAE